MSDKGEKRETGDVADLLDCLPCKQEDLSLIPRIHIKKKLAIVVCF